MSDTTKESPPYQAPAEAHIQATPQIYIQSQVHNIPPSSIAAHSVVQPVQQNERWWRRNKRHKPQLNSVGTVSLIFISGGMNMAWNLGLAGTATYYLLTEHILISWFLGGIIGAVIGAFACSYVSKKLLVGFASILVTICGVLQVSDPNSYDAILASRYLNGIAVGLVFPMTFVLIGEELVKSLRGKNAASVDTMRFGGGIFIHIVYCITRTSTTGDTFQSIQISGLLNIAYGIVTLIMVHLHLIESPLFYLSRGDDQMAIESLKRLQKPFAITYETHEQLEEHKLYLAESKEKTFIQNAVYGIPALLKLCFYRSFMALGFSYIVNLAFTYASFTTTLLEAYPYILYALARLLGSLIASYTLDSKGRKTPMIFGFFVCTILAFTVGGIFDEKLNYFEIDSFNTVKYLLIFFQLFTSISMASSSAYLSEAFPLAIKPYYVAIVFIVEMLIQIIIISCKYAYMENMSNFSDYFLTLGALSLLFLGVAIFLMPETKLCSLRECLPKFRKINNYRN